MISPIDILDPQWQSLYQAAHADPTQSGWTPFHHPALINAVAHAHRLTPIALGASGDARLNAAMCVLAPQPGTPWPISACPFNGPMIRPTHAHYRARRDKFTSQHLVALMQALIEQARWAHVRIPAGQFDPRALIAAGFRLTPSFTYEVPIATSTHLREQLLPDRRRQVRQAERSGVSVREVTLESESTARRWGPIIHAQHATQSQRRGLEPDTDADGFTTLLMHGIDQPWLRLFVAQTQTGIPCAFQVTTVQIPVAANLLTGCDLKAPSGTNALLRTAVFSQLAEEGVCRFDLNGARPGDGGRFKASLGGRLVERWDIAPPIATDPPQRFPHRLRRLWWALKRYKLAESTPET